MGLNDFFKNGECIDEFLPSETDNFLEELKNEDLNEIVEPAKSEEKPKGRRGRPKKSADDVVGAESKSPKKSKTLKKITESVESVEVEESSPKVKVNIDLLPVDVIREVYENFSKKPVEELAKNVGINSKNIYKIISKLESIFTLSITTGDLTQEKFDSVIVPNLKEFSKKSNYDEVVSEIIKTV